MANEQNGIWLWVVGTIFSAFFFAAGVIAAIDAKITALDNKSTSARDALSAHIGALAVEQRAQRERIDRAREDIRDLQRARSKGNQ